MGIELNINGRKSESLGPFFTHGVSSISTRGLAKKSTYFAPCPSLNAILPPSYRLFLIGTLILGQVVLLQQCRDLIRAP